MQAGSVNVPASVSLNIGSRSQRRSYGSRSRSYGRRKYSRSRYSVSRYQRRAIARRAYVRGKWPSSQYAHVYVPRGSQAAQALGMTPGQTFQEANAENQALRRSMGWYGKGGYWGNLLGKAAGSFLGGPTGAAIGGFLGDKAGDMASSFFGGGGYSRLAGRGAYSRLSGRGAYEEGAPAANDTIMEPSASSVVPTFAGKDLTAITLSHREYIRDIYAPAAGTPFYNIAAPINPGLPTLFPWLSQLASNFEEYMLLQCVFTFKTTVADFAAASGQVGQVVMATQYNATSEPFADKETMMMYEGAMSCKTSQDMLHGVECDPHKLPDTNGCKLVRYTSLPSTEDLKQYDLGQLNLALLNAPATYAGQALGELWVTYTVVLRKPKLCSLNGNSISRDDFSFFLPGSALLNVATARTCSDAVQLVAAKNSYGCSLSQVSDSTGSANFKLDPASQPLTGFGSVSDPLDILANEVPYSVYSSAWGSVPSAAHPWYTAAPGGMMGCYLTHCLTFPDNAQGPVEIRLRYADLSLSAPIPTMQFLGAGNVFRFKDIVENTGVVSPVTQRFSHYVRTVNNALTDLPSNPQTDFEALSTEQILHVRLLPATNGIRNRLYLGFPVLTVAVSSVIISTTLLQVVVSNYNASSSQSVSGQKDRILYQYAATGVPYVTI